MPGPNRRFPQPWRVEETDLNAKLRHKVPIGSFETIPVSEAALVAFSRAGAENSRRALFVSRRTVASHPEGALLWLCQLRGDAIRIPLQFAWSGTPLIE